MKLAAMGPGRRTVGHGIPAGSRQMTISTVKVRDGAQLVYEVRGRVKDAPPVVLIHSLGMDHTFWNAVTPALTETTAVLVYDCRGHGRSDKPAGPYRVEAFADDLADLLDHVGWRSAVDRRGVDGRVHHARLRRRLSASAPPGSACSTPPPGTMPPTNGRSARAPPRPRASKRCSNSRPPAGSPMPSARAARTCSTRASPCSSPTPRKPMRRPAACSVPAT